MSARGLRDARAAQRSWTPRTLVILAVLGLALPLFPLVFTQPFTQHIAIMVLLYATLAQAWNILGGYAGQLSVGHAVYFGLGAYTSTLLMTTWGLSPWLGMLAGGAVAMLVAALLAFPTFRLKGLYFAIATLQVSVIFKDLFVNWRQAGGAVGVIFPILPETLLNFQFHNTKLPYYYIVLAMCIATFATTWIIERRPLGYFLRAIRDEPDAAMALGVDLRRHKLTAALISSFFTAIAGTFYAQYVLFISPDSVFALGLSILIALMAVLGGTGAFWGPAVGAALLVPLAELSRAYFGGRGDAANLLIYGTLIVLIAIWQPRGLVGLLQRWLGSASPRAPGPR